MGDPSAVRRQTLSEEVDLGPGNMETEAPELTNRSLYLEEGDRRTTELWFRFWFRLRLRVKEQLGVTGRFDVNFRLPDC